MVERVKAAIAEKMAPAIDARAPYAKVMFDMAARAAIEAMREVPAVCHDEYDLGKIWRQANSTEVWNAWINAALR